ncbi:hypothetical protein EON65_55270 [archaeon]|nr:MAG: hypothetical protein EON65_55270 [archaeon]
MSHPKTNRNSAHKDATARAKKESIEIVYDAELKDLTFIPRCLLALSCCTVYDLFRSYLYLRENSIESNISFAPCCGLCTLPDFVTVQYFDRFPYAETWKCAPRPFCCLLYRRQPKLEVIKPGCLVCGVPVNICDETEQVVLMPFETFPFPCCWFANRVSAWDNCFGFCGGITGNPRIYSRFFPQPTDPQGFVQVAQPLMLSGNLTPAGTVYAELHMIEKGRY